MKIGKQAVNFSSALLLFALSACLTATVSQDSTKNTAITDNRPNASVERSVGKLRRLVIAPVGYKVIEGSLALFGGTKNENNFKKALLSETMSLLNDWKGYAAVPIDLYLLIKPRFCVP